MGVGFFTGAPSAPSGRAAAGVNDVNIISLDQLFEAANVFPHDQRVFGMHWQVDVDSAKAGEFVHARTAVGNDDSLCTAGNDFRSDINATLLCAAGAELGDDLHDDGLCLKRLHGVLYDVLRILARELNDMSRGPEYLEREGQPRLAYHYTPGSSPMVMFCGGYRSDMGGTKATYLEAQCAARGQGYLRFDYSGHGDSEGDFNDGTIGAWFSDALAILDEVAQGPVILVGSSMGGWMALLLARARPERIAGLVGIAPAPDFSRDVYAKFSDEHKRIMDEQGFVEIPNDYSDEPYHFTKAFFDDGDRHLVLDQPQSVTFPVHLIHGQLDVDVPYELSIKIQEMYGDSNVRITFVEDGDHRLSRPQDLELIDGVIQGAT